MPTWERHQMGWVDRWGPRVVPVGWAPGHGSRQGLEEGHHCVSRAGGQDDEGDEDTDGVGGAAVVGGSHEVAVISEQEQEDQTRRHEDGREEVRVECDRQQRRTRDEDHQARGEGDPDIGQLECLRISGGWR